MTTKHTAALATAELILIFISLTLMPSVAWVQESKPLGEPSYVSADINNLVLQQWRNDDKSKVDDMCTGDKLLTWNGKPLIDNDDLVRRWLASKAGDVTTITVERTVDFAGKPETRKLEIKYVHEAPSDLFKDCMAGGREGFRNAAEIHPEWETVELPLKQVALKALSTKADAILAALNSAFDRQLQIIKDHYRSDHASYLLTRPFQAEVWARYYLTPAEAATQPSPIIAAAWQLAEPQSRSLPAAKLITPLPAEATFEQCVITLEARLREVDIAFADAFSGLSREEIEQLRAWTKDFKPVWRDEPGWTEFVAGMQVTKKIAPDKLAAAIAISGMLVDDLVPGGAIFERLKASSENVQAGKFGSRTTVLGKDTDQATIKTDITIDLGGDDAFVLSAAPVPGTSRVIIDLGGDDTFLDRGGGLAAGIGAMSLVVNTAGNDVYLSGSRSLGFGLIGLGLVWDVDGHDYYRGSFFSQGVGCLGLGLLVDQAGNDRYDASSFSQAVGLTAGCGMILDRAGDDVYTCTGKDASPYDDAGEYAGWCQGCGFGFRSAGAGGVGALMDLAGRDFYRAGQFGLGCGYFFGVGIVHDLTGDDVFECSRYGLASAAHYAVGIVLDDAGRDSYLALRSASVASLGSTWDLCVGLLIDGAGDDVYQAEVYTMGGAAQTSYGFFWDKQGRDSYRSSGGTAVEAAGYIGGATYGGGRLARNLAIFLDEGAAVDDYHLPERKNNASGVYDEFGIWVDR